ncbi:hypothetical protein LRP52_37170 [Photobacterium sp. ZSDE20]|uniref:Single-stranded DNA-binding protein n=1 Tax=Photobacterium pectinilyticum TaxID=2906793 RepID=A0ABT1NBC7_9GAMM|nr:hypothetical protein [Photobacterium sp. ZSDE20]MCQ1060624.1 hypothetical protein [Photobacterium sp. ZSDE20]MDD1827819.1 hypothetical protein [Photobacterium sp. ZSDE20]
MFFNQNSTNFGGNVGRVETTSNGCLKFGICQSVKSKTLDTGNQYHDNWLNVILTKKQTEHWQGRINSGDEILVNGELRIGKHDGQKTIVLFVNRIEGHAPKMHRTVGNLLNKLTEQSVNHLVDQLPAVFEQLGLQINQKEVNRLAQVSNAQAATPEAATSQFSPQQLAAAMALLQQQTQPAAQTQPMQPVQQAAQPAQTQPMQPVQQAAQPAQTQPMQPVQQAAQPAQMQPMQPVQPAAQPVQTQPAQPAATPQPITIDQLTTASKPEPDWVNEGAEANLQQNAATYAAGNLQPNAANFFKQ